MQAAFGLVVTTTGLGTTVFNFLVDGVTAKVGTAVGMVRSLTEDPFLIGRELISQGCDWPNENLVSIPAHSHDLAPWTGFHTL